MKKEVEVKAKLSEGTDVVEALRKLGCELSSPKTQDDTVYVRQTGSVSEYLSNAEFLRLRVENDGTTLFTLKYHPGRADDPTSAPIECESKVDSREQIAHMLQLMGFSEAVRIRKSRMKTKHGAWEICVDEVEGLGSFIELEEMADRDADIPGIQEKMREFLASLGVSQEDIGLARYDVLLLERTLV